MFFCLLECFVPLIIHTVIVVKVVIICIIIDAIFRLVKDFAIGIGMFKKRIPFFIEKREFQTLNVCVCVLAEVHNGI